MKKFQYITTDDDGVNKLIQSHYRVSVMYNTIVEETNKFTKGICSSMCPGSKGIMKPA